MAATQRRLDPSPEAARAALEAIHGWTRDTDEMVEISIKRADGAWVTAASSLDDVLRPDGGLEVARRVSAAGGDIYFGVCSLTGTPEEGRRGKKALRGHAGALWLDVDVRAPGRDGEVYFESVEAAATAVDSALSDLGGRHLLIGSGWGVQYWIPLAKPVPAERASRAVRALVNLVAERTGKKIDRVWDSTRVMRMPGTYNWRGGFESPTGVLIDSDISGVIAESGFVTNGDDAVDENKTDRPVELLSIAAIEKWLAECGHPVADFLPGKSDADREAYASMGTALLDLYAIAEEAWTWPDLLVPWGWTRIESYGPNQEWHRPGPTPDRAEGKRSAVVYHDAPNLLVVYSDSDSTGFKAGLRGAGARGDGAGVGVITKWNAWVDLAWHGDNKAASAWVWDQVLNADAIGGWGWAEQLLLDAVAKEWAWTKEWVLKLRAERSRLPYTSAGEVTMAALLGVVGSGQGRGDQ